MKELKEEFWVCRECGQQSKLDLSSMHVHAWSGNKQICKNKMILVSEVDAEPVVKEPREWSLVPDNKGMLTAFQSALVNGIRVREILPDEKKPSELQEMLDKISVRGWNTADSLFYDDLKPLLQKIIDRLEKK